MEEKRLVPKRRFEGFSKELNSLKFEEMVTRTSQIIEDDKLPQLEYQDIVSSLGRLNKDITKKDINKKGVLFNKNDVLFGNLRPYLKNWLLANFKGIAIGDFWVFRSNGCESKYIYYLIQSKRYQQVANLSIGTKMPRSDWSTVSNTIFYIPVIEEQQKIGEFFRVLDDRIANQERKIAKVKALKEAYLTEMFPQEGETVPKRRFKGFEGEWDKNKLGDFGSVEMNKRIFKWQTTEFGDVPFYKIGTFGKKPDAFISNELFNEYKQKFPYPQKGDLLISASGSIGKVVEFTGEKEYFQDSNIVWLKHNGRLSNLFLRQFYNIVKWGNLEGSTIQRLYNRDILETMILVPSSYQEQQKIGSFFKNLDDQIRVEEAKLEKLKKMKAAYLEEMFV